MGVLYSTLILGILKINLIMKNIIKFFTFYTVSTVFLFACSHGVDSSIVQDQDPAVIDHVIVHKEDGHFLGWPANNGIWKWDDGELLVGFTRGEWYERSGHNISNENRESWLARSQDGGVTWKAFDPEGFVGDSLYTLQEISEPINFSDENLAFLQVGIGYHGSNVPEGGFFYSYDRGETWNGPFKFEGLSHAEELDGLEITNRTNYLIESESSALLFMSARSPGQWRSENGFVARTTDGGITFEFISWIEDTEDPYRAVMPSAVRTHTGDLVAAMRRRDMGNNQYCWVDIYTSQDNGETWEFLSRAGETGWANGNPPALTQLSDGRLVVAYGNREHRQIRARLSSNNGLTWGSEFILREGNEQDIGYPQMIQNEDGNIVTLYYWADSPDSEKYIAATIWDPGNKEIWNQPVNISSK